MKNEKIKTIVEYLLLFMGYIIIPSLVAGILKGTFSTNALVCTYIGNIIFLLIAIFIFKKEFKKDSKDLKTNLKRYLKLCLKWWFIGLLIMMISNYIINIYVFNGNIATNESLVRDYIFNTPILSLLSVCFIAPIVEEIMFRISFRKLFKKDWLFILCSGLLFGFLHAVSNESLLGLLYIIPYGSLGSAFAYVYTKTNNVFCSIIMHIIHNSTTFMLLYFAYNAISLGAS